MEAFERKYLEYMKKLQDEMEKIEKDSQANEILHQARIETIEARKGMNFFVSLFLYFLVWESLKDKSKRLNWV